MRLEIWAIAIALAQCGLNAAPGAVYQLTTVAGSDMVGDGGAAVAAQVDQPEGLVVDSAGNLYGVTESGDIKAKSGSSTHCRNYGCGVVFKLER